MIFSIVITRIYSACRKVFTPSSGFVFKNAENAVSYIFDKQFRQMAWVNTSSANERDAGAPCSPKTFANESGLSDSTSRRRSDESPRVGFHSPGATTNDGGFKDREKYLTAKYPKHTMGLIRRRLAVEDWIDEQLKRLYNVVSCAFVGVFEVT